MAAQGSGYGYSSGGRKNNGKELKPSVARNECFKCGLPGHFARDCPSAGDQQMRASAVNAQPNVGGEHSSKDPIVYSYGGRKSPYWEDDCFKCGRSGHWQRECPLVNGGKDDGGDGKRREFDVSLGWPF